MEPSREPSANHDLELCVYFVAVETIVLSCVVLLIVSSYQSYIIRAFDDSYVLILLQMVGNQVYTYKSNQRGSTSSSVLHSIYIIIIYNICIAPYNTIL